MKARTLSTIFVILIFGLFIFGLFTSNAFAFVPAFCLWTPAILWWGIALGKAGFSLQNPFRFEQAEKLTAARPTNPKTITAQQARGTEFK